MMDVYGFLKCPDCGNIDLDLFDSKGGVEVEFIVDGETPAPLVIPFSLKSFRDRYDIACFKKHFIEVENYQEEFCRFVDSTVIFLPKKLPLRYKQKIDSKDIEYDDNLGLMSFTLRKGEKEERIEVVRTRVFVRLSEEHIPKEKMLTSPPFGVYIVDTRNGGGAMIEVLPHRETNGRKNWDETEWYLVGMDPYAGPKLSPPKKAAKLTNYNFKAFFLLSEIEQRLRNFIVRVLGDNGEKWWDAIIPREIREQVNKRKEDNLKNNPYTQKDLPPICYATFPNLREIFEKKWNNFKDVLPRKIMLFGDLGKLEYIRNDVAHNRPINKEEYTEIERVGREVYKWINRAEK